MFWQAKCVVIRKNKQMGIFIRGVKCGCVCVCVRERKEKKNVGELEFSEL